jgi:hypothetical protein
MAEEFEVKSQTAPLIGDRHDPGQPRTPPSPPRDEGPTVSLAFAPKPPRTEPPDEIINEHVHAGRYLKPAGEMLVGSRALAPVLTPDGAGLAGYSQPQIFTSRPEGGRGLSGGRAVMLICTVAVGTTAAMAQLLYRPGDASVVAADIAASLTPGGGSGGGATPVAAYMTLKDAGRTPPIVIRVAQGGSSGLVVEDVAGDSNLPLRMKVRINQRDDEEYAFIMFRGLPESFTFSAGFRLKDAWAVSMRDLPDLILLPPSDYRGNFEIEVLLVKGRDKPVESQTLTVRIGAPARQPAIAAAGGKADERLLTSASPAPVTDDREAAPAQSQQSGKSPGITLKVAAKEETEMLDRAIKILGDGDIASARLLLEHIARKGSGKGALTLAQTYDPLFLRSISAVGGIGPDPEKAKLWYKLAAELGEEGARERLGALSAR